MLEKIVGLKTLSGVVWAGEKSREGKKEKGLIEVCFGFIGFEGVGVG